MYGFNVMVRVRWEDPAWVNMHLPGGMIHNWTRRNTSNAANWARGFAPVRSGALRASVRADNRTSGPHSIRSYVRAGGPRAPHAVYVTEGTIGPIFANDRPAIGGGTRTGYLRLAAHPAGGYPNVTFREAVNGQKANNFLMRGVEVEIRAINAGAR